MPLLLWADAAHHSRTDWHRVQKRGAFLKERQQEDAQRMENFGHEDAECDHYDYECDRLSHGHVAGGVV